MDRADQQMFSKKEVVRWADLFDGERRYYKEILNELPCPVAVIDAQLRLVATNRSFRDRFQLNKEDASGRLDASDVQAVINAATTATAAILRTGTTLPGTTTVTRTIRDTPITARP